jgi:two-component system phosphate regulon sensor histidine kinase PhoR
MSRLAWLPALVGLFVGLPVAVVAPAWVAVALAVLAGSACAFVLFSSVLRPLQLQADALREAERRFQATVAQSQRDRAQMVAIFEHMADGLFVLDSNEHIELSNPAAARLLHRPHLDGLPLAEAVRDAEVVETVRAAPDSHPVAQLVELRPSPSSPRSWLNIVATRVPDERRTLVILQDVTELRRAEAARRDFVANVSHELRTPVASLKALVETLEAGAINDPLDGPDFLRRMHVEVDGLAQLVTELLELARIEAGRLELDLQVCRADELVRNAVERIQPYASRVGLEVTTSVFPQDLWVRADARRIGQVLSNLLSNAVKFTPPGGTVTAGAVRAGRSVEISIVDSGVGIAADQLLRVFERFYKTDPARTSSGTGLGLAICKHVVLAHGGVIHADSPGTGLGATFAFTLPSAAVVGSHEGEPHDGHMAPTGSLGGPATEQLTSAAQRSA